MLVFFHHHHVVGANVRLAKLIVISVLINHFSIFVFVFLFFVSEFDSFFPSNSMHINKFIIFVWKVFFLLLIHKTVIYPRFDCIFRPCHVIITPWWILIVFEMCICVFLGGIMLLSPLQLWLSVSDTSSETRVCLCSLLLNGKMDGKLLYIEKLVEKLPWKLAVNSNNWK